MTPKEYDVVRGAFLEAAALEEGPQREYMRRLMKAQPDIYSEVASLLDYNHTRTLVDVDRAARTTAVGADAPTIQVQTPDAAVRKVSVLRRFRERRGRPLLLALLGLGLLLGASYFVLAQVQSSLQTLVADSLQGVARARAATLTGWFRDLQRQGEAVAEDAAVTAAVAELLEMPIRGRDAAEIAADPAQDRIAEAVLAAFREQARRESARAASARRREAVDAAWVDFSALSEAAELEAAGGLGDDLRYAVWRPDLRLVANWDRGTDTFGDRATDNGARMLNRVFDGETVVYVPDGTAYVRGYQFKARPEVAVTAPVYGADGEIVAALLVGGVFQSAYESLLRRADFGESGEVYAVVPGRGMASQSRFGEDLRTIGFIEAADAPTSGGLRVLDPGRNLLEADEPAPQNADWPPTRAARDVLEKRSGYSVEPYRDYRGVSVVGAWEWLPEFGLGLITEMDRDEAFATLDSLRGITRKTFGLLAFSTLLAGLLSYHSFRRSSRETAAKRVGAYTLGGVLGEGGMGRVYRAEHDLLCRPAAVKILKPESATAEMSARFEREVRLASRLESPHTIEVYDFGATGEGEGQTFYCAMEILDGITLRQLIRDHGPQPPARVAYILRQVCRSLSEAHLKGLVHRDIKPANIMLSDRGGTPDFVTVLDFGLAKERASTRPADSNVTKTSMLLGTPEFIAPERIRHPNLIDPRSDLYALGVVAYLMLTGESVFEATSELETLEKTLYADPPPPSERRPDAGIPPALDRAVLSCLKKEEDDRPDSASILLMRLEEISFRRPWGEREARAWWDANA